MLWYKKVLIRCYSQLVEVEVFVKMSFRLFLPNQNHFFLFFIVRWIKMPLTRMTKGFLLGTQIHEFYGIFIAISLIPIKFLQKSYIAKNP